MRSFVAVACRPGLWSTALRVLAGLARPGWTRSWPPLPTPDSEYLRFRMITAYGDAAASPAPADAVAYLEWCRSWHATIDR